ncbi:SHOCT domain-containing protein [Colwellia sp. 1_MG-2023]|uniref:SHOCT domain-containing protein n=1 Tax=Colwellia sp. 1_MG-2023 TaxID=3062649 RepID=UPI0026E4616D|nr:SHOCT domain-containing protein [Colwellia sp. 1_MG-2023]MDO6444951.1 SHOCT domain-containing protein [Colwellia sp. 1_MG-2023]
MHYLIYNFSNKIAFKAYYTLIILLTFLGKVHAEALNSSLKVYHHFQNQSNIKWQAINKNPSTKQSYFVHDDVGNIHLVKDNEINAEPIIHLKKHFPQAHLLNDISLHPSFKLQQDYGYLTLYTAHIEPPDNSKSALRIHDNNQQNEHKFEIVISEWQFDNDKFTSFKTTKNRPREVLRIPTFSIDNGITQLGFNPYMKSWNDNYGNLYFTLKADPNKPDSALYSGSILRINPKRFGLKNYSIPERNPFINTEDINNEIIATGLTSLFEIHWSKDGKQQLLVTQSNPQTFSAATIKYGEDFRKNKTELTYIQAPLPQQSNSVIYRGMKFAKFRNNIIYLTWDNHWKLIAIDNEHPFEVSTLLTIKNNDFSKSSKLALLTDEHDELLVVDKSSNVIFTVNSPTESSHPNKKQTVNKTPAQQDYVNFSWIILIPLFIASIVILRRMKKSNLPKALLRKQFAKYEVHENKKHLTIYKRHEEIASTEVNISEIKRCEIFLNNNLIYSFNSSEAQSCFSNEKEQMLNLSFSTEKRGKMIDDKVRKIEMVLTDQTSHTYPICVYLRKGNQRLTSGKYEEICKQLIDWCWLLSQTIFPALTEERIILKPVVPNTPNMNKTNKSETTDAQSLNKNHNVTGANNAKPQEPKSLSTTPTDHNTAEVDESVELKDISLINALDKLGKLKQQGLLTEEEFNQAKAKVLNNLTQND